MSIDNKEVRIKKYDLNCEFQENEKYTIDDLCIEIDYENQEKIGTKKTKDTEERKDTEETNDTKERIIGLTDIKCKFHHTKKTGILDKLCKNFNFDIKFIGARNRNEYFDMLKLMKYLYYSEKFYNLYVVKADKKLKNDKPVSILDILAKPRLENIKDSDVQYDNYEERLNKVKSDISMLVDKSDIIYKTLEIINLQWNYVMHKIMDYVFSNMAIECGESALNELKRINNQLSDNIIVRLPTVLPEEACSKHIMEGFYSILISHSFLCEDHDWQTINDESTIVCDITEDYADLTESLDNELCSLSILEQSKKYLSGKSDDREAALFLNRVSYNKTIESDEIKKYRYALDNAPKVIECLEKYYGRDFSESIGFNVLVAIVQELIYVRENNVKVTNDFYKYNNKETSLKLLTQNADRVIPEIVKEAWIRRVENRVAMNYGQQELMKVKRQIENKIFSIKAFVYSYRNYDDAKFVSDFLYRLIADIIFSSKSACNYGKEIFNKISAKISVKIKGYYVDVAMNSVNIMAYLKTMLLNKDILEEKIINEISFSVINSYKENSFLVYDSTYYFNIEKYNINEEYLLVYRINKIKRSLLFSKFRRIIKEEQLEKAVELGLEKFLENY